MSMNALSESDCQEILEEFRLGIPNAPIAVLTELAFNYGLEAPIDIDPMDVVSILASPRTPEVFSVEIDNQCGVETGFSELMSHLCDRSVSLSTCAGALLIVNGHHIELAGYGRTLSTLHQILHPQAQWGYALYNSGVANPKIILKLILAGIDSLTEFTGQRQSVSPVSIPNEIPAFLRLHSNEK